MPEKPEDYLADARSDAADAVEHFEDEIVAQLVQHNKASDDMRNDYPGGDSYHHENYVDKMYSLIEAANLLDQLSNYEETDGGLWEGLEPREAVKAQAAFTYGNAVYSLWRELIEEINKEVEDEGPWPGTTGPKDWAPKQKNAPESWMRRLVGQVVKNWRK